MEFGDYLKEARMSAKMTQDDLGKALGVNRARIAQLENNYYHPAPETVKRIAGYFGDKKFEKMLTTKRLLAAASDSLQETIAESRDKTEKAMGVSIQRLTNDLLKLVDAYNDFVTISDKLK